MPGNCCVDIDCTEMCDKGEGGRLCFINVMIAEKESEINFDDQLKYEQESIPWSQKTRIIRRKERLLN
jgi:hypothetical protein